MQNITCVLLIDKRLANYDEIIASANAVTACVVFDYNIDTFDTLRTRGIDRITPENRMVCTWDANVEVETDAQQQQQQQQQQQVREYRNIGLMQHNATGAQYFAMANELGCRLDNVAESDPSLTTWANYIEFINTCVRDYGLQTYDMMACALYSDANWKYAIDEMTVRCGVTIRASLDNTGTATLGGNWYLELGGVNLKDVYFTDAIDGYNGLLSANSYHFLVLGTPGTASYPYGTGYNSHGQLGVGNNSNRNGFIIVANAKTCKAISCGMSHTAILNTDNTIYVMGNNGNGQLGIDSLVTVMPLPSGKTPKGVFCGGYHTVVFMTDNTIYATGANIGELGVGDIIDRKVLTAMTIPSGKTPMSVCAGGRHTVVLMTDNTIYATGLNNSGQLGIGTNDTYKNVLTAMTMPSGKIPISIACSDSNTILLMADGTVYATGNNSYGQFGNGNTTSTNALTSMTIPSGKTPKGISCGEHHAVVIMTDNTMYSSGYNGGGQLGTGNNNSSSNLVVMTMPSGKTPQSISCGGYHTSVLMTDETIYATGDNSRGTLGIGNNNATNVLTQCPGSAVGLADAAVIISYTNMSSAIYESIFTSHTFTNAGATGRTGPTLSAVRTAYSTAVWTQDTTNNWLEMTSANNGIQLWKVPKTGNYTIEAYGAQGGNADTATGGLGARIKIFTSLVKNDIIKILCGQQGGTATVIATSYNHPIIAGGGGGGTYIYNVTTSRIILIAGGGGGAAKGDLNSGNSSGRYILNVVNASAYNVASGSDGTAGGNNTYGKGGMDGDSGTVGNAGGSSGAGWNGSGVQGIYGGVGGLSFNLGGTGGENAIFNGDFVTNTQGGFGGGSGSGFHSNFVAAAGGGGGYSGGGGGGQNIGGGGGGGNYMIAGSTYISSSTNTGHGKVIITFLLTTPATLTFLKTAFYAKYVLNSTISIPATFSTNNSDTGKTVTHASGNSGVATVTTSANVGTVTVKGLGTTTITSTLAATMNFDAVTVTSITITVVGSGSTLTGATMTSVDLSETNLTGSVFSGCDLTSANLYGATFNENTDFSGSTLTSLKSGRINGFTTLLPAGYKMI